MLALCSKARLVMGKTERLKESTDKKLYGIQWGQLSSPAPGNEEP